MTAVVPPPAASTPASTHGLLDDLLDAAVRVITGSPTAKAREGQRRLAHDVLDAMHDGTRRSAEAPTGSGKTLAVLAPAMLLARLGERTLISTESISLQSQYVAKDAPAVAEALETVFEDGQTPSVGVYKGWSNYACPAAVASIVRAKAGVSFDKMAETAKTLKDDVSADGRGLADLVAWSATQVADGGTADRSAYPGSAPDELWEKVSVSTSKCLGLDRCPFGHVCRSDAARERAASNDVVVTNHSMLATQSAKNIPAVVGNRRLGVVDHLVVDEAHALPDKVRSAGSASISAARIARAVAAVSKAALKSAMSERMEQEGHAVADAVDGHLVWLLAGGRELKLGDDDTPLDEVRGLVVSWVGLARKCAAASKDELASFHAFSVLDGISGDLSVVNDGRPGVARWVEAGRPDVKGRWSGAAAKLAPVDTAGPLRGGLYDFEQVRPRPDDDVDDGEDDGEPELVRMSVNALSATLPQASVAALGLGGRREYPSPFAKAYARSLAYVPRPEDGAGGRDGLVRPGGGKPRLDTARHPEWAVPLIERLIRANGGSALVLAATERAGRFYVDRLRAVDVGVIVHSQWDGVDRSIVVGRWRDDHDSVLVGTRSFWTGVDAPGSTASLVVADRVPRAAGNPIDDARVADLQERLDCDGWTADRYVYYGDALLMLEQGVGRLIRTESDSGVVAILDPRLLKGPLAYPAPTRKMLLGALERFEHRTDDLSTVMAALGKQSGRDAA